MKVLIALLLTMNVFAADEVVERLKAENATLKKQIEMNNLYIQERSKSNYDVKKPVLTENIKRRHYFSVGIDQNNWTNSDYNLDATFYMATYGYNFDHFTLEGAVGQARVYGFPVGGSETLITNMRIGAKYNFKPTDYMEFSPFVAINSVSVNSPDAGIIDAFVTGEMAEDELTFVDYIEGNYLNAGLEFGYNVTEKIKPRIRAEIAGAIGIHLDYKI